MWSYQNLIRIKNVWYDSKVFIWRLIQIKNTLYDSKVSRWRLIGIKNIWIESKRQNARPETKNDMNQDILIRFMIDTIQGIMIQITIHDQQETKAKRQIDTIQNNVNRIKDLEKRFCHSTKKIFTQKRHTWHNRTIWHNETMISRHFNMF